MKFGSPPSHQIIILNFPCFGFEIITNWFKLKNKKITKIEWQI